MEYNPFDSGPIMPIQDWARFDAGIFHLIHGLTDVARVSHRHLPGISAAYRKSFDRQVFWWQARGVR